MSNPGVVKLAGSNVQGQRVWFDDNVGESIHFHMQDFRIDFKIKEFCSLVNELYDVVDDLIGVENFSTRDFDPVFLEQILLKKLPDLERISYDKINVASLNVPQIGWKKIFKKNINIASSRCMQALLGKDKDINIKRKSDHINQTGKQRLDCIKKSIEDNYYPYDNKYIVLFNDENIIRDGQHRAACIYYAYGNIEIPVVRLYFKEGKYSDKKNVSIIGLMKKIIENKMLMGKCIRIVYWNVNKFVCITYLKIYGIMHRKENLELEKIFKNQFMW